MTPETIVGTAVWLALAILGVAFLLTIWRVIRGPTLPDRVVALDMLVGIVIGFIALIAIRTGFTLYIDIAIALGLVGFLATIAFARFILSRRSRSLHITVVETAVISSNPRSLANKSKKSVASINTGPADGTPGGKKRGSSKKSTRRKGGK